MKTKTQRTRRRPAALAKLMTVAGTLGPDELRVLAALARRLHIGAERYGKLDLARDGRDFAGREAREEVEDFLVYAACGWLKARGQRPAAARGAS